MFHPALRRCVLVIACLALIAGSPLRGADPAPRAAGADDFADLPALNPEKSVLIDAKGKRLLLRSEVVLREGLLEMLVCLKQTKEHEAILSVPTKAKIVHAGLLALGAQPGSPVRWEPEYQPATGQPIEIFFSWTDENGQRHRDPAQSWVRHATRRYFVEPVPGLPANFQTPDDSELKWDKKHDEILWYGPMSAAQRDALLKLSAHRPFQDAIQKIFRQSQVRQMEAGWVFAGSYFLEDEKTKEKYYQAESGDLICVANFATATLDLSVSSSATNNDLMFEAYTERIPPVGTKVTVELIPTFKPQPKPGGAGK